MELICSVRYTKKQLVLGNIKFWILDFVDIIVLFKSKIPIFSGKPILFQYIISLQTDHSFGATINKAP